jgi:hypothetical protein
VEEMLLCSEELKLLMTGTSEAEAEVTLFW